MHPIRSFAQSVNELFLRSRMGQEWTTVVFLCKDCVKHFARVKLMFLTRSIVASFYTCTISETLWALKWLDTPITPLSTVRLEMLINLLQAFQILAGYCIIQCTLPV